MFALCNITMLIGAAACTKGSSAISNAQNRLEREYPGNPFRDIFMTVGEAREILKVCMYARTRSELSQRLLHKLYSFTESSANICTLKKSGHTLAHFSSGLVCGLQKGRYAPSTSSCTGISLEFPGSWSWLASLTLSLLPSSPSSH